MKSDGKLIEFLEYFSAHHALYWPAIEDNRRRHKDVFESLGGAMVEWAAAYLGDEYKRVLSEGYVRFVTDVNRSQARYERSGRYPEKAYEDVFNHVYGNPEFMSFYHWGVYVTTFAWEHHLRLYEFFRDYFVSLLNSQKGTVLDLGSGSGVWDLLLLRLRPEWKVNGVDISGTSVGFANKIAERNGFGGRAAYVEEDALKYAGSEQVDACLSCFLLEHLERPGELLRNLERNLLPRGFAFVTGALTAAEVDHIGEFRRESELIGMAEEANFRVVATYSAAPGAYPQEYRYLPRSMGLVLQKKKNDIW